jgi:chromosome segregation ATPase
MVLQFSKSQEEIERLKKAQAQSMVDEKATAENAKLRADLAAMRAEHTKEVRSLGDEHEKEVESLKGDIKALGEQLAIARGEASMLEEAQKPARHQLASLEQDLADALVIKGHLQVEVDQLEARCKELGESLERSEKEVMQLKRGVDDAKACVAALEKELAQVHRAALKREEAINSGAKSAQGKLEDALREAEGRVNAAEEKARELEGRAAAAEKASKAAKSLSDHARGEVQARMDEIEKQSETIKALEGKVAGGLEAEEAMKDELARERAASKALQEEKKALEKRSEEEKKALEKRSEEEKKALQKRSEEEKKALEKRSEEEKKALENKVAQLDKEVREGGERVKAVSSSAEELQGEVMGLAKLFEGTKKRSEEGLASVSSRLGGRIKELEGEVAKGRKDAALKLQDAEKRLSIAQGEVKELTMTVNALKETSGGSRKKVEELEERLKKADCVKTAAIATAEGAQGESKRLRERLLEMEAKYLGEVQNVQRLSKELGDAEDQCKVSNAEAKGARADAKTHQQKMGDLKSRIRELEAVVEKVQGEQLEGARRIKELLDERDRAASGAGAATDEATRLREKVTSLEEALASSKDEASDLEAQVARLEVDLSTAERGIDLSISAGKVKRHAQPLSAILQFWPTVFPSHPCECTKFMLLSFALAFPLSLPSTSTSALAMPFATCLGLHQILTFCMAMTGA